MITHLVLLASLAIPIVPGCPPAQELAPCVCDYIKGTDEYQVTCPGVQNELAITQAVYALRHSSKLSKFTIRDGVFRFIPQDAFNGISIDRLQIVNCTLMALTDTDKAFRGLEDSLDALAVYDSMVLNDWDWGVLKNFEFLRSLHVDVDLDIVSRDIDVLGRCCRIKDLNLADNRITYVDDFAFANFDRLLVFSMSNNLVSVVKRSMFPNPAPLLWHLDFSGNQIEQLPPDLFENMPRLSSVFLKSNKIISLGESTFAKVWPQLKIILALDNPLRCDCRMEWLTKIEEIDFPGNTKAVCDTPLNLRGKPLSELTTYDVYC